ncbi:MAG: hypothetical protein ACQERC_08050, partial [Bacteroidota bacterium]
MAVGLTMNQDQKLRIKHEFRSDYSTFVIFLFDLLYFFSLPKKVKQKSLAPGNSPTHLTFN